MSTPYDKESIGPMLTRLRQARGYSRTQLAQQLCALSGQPTVSYREVARWERQDRIPTDYWLRWLSTALRVPLGTLQSAAAITRSHRTGQADPGASLHLPPGAVSSVTVSHNPRGLSVALDGVTAAQLAQLRAACVPTGTESAPTATPMEADQ